MEQIAGHWPAGETMPASCEDFRARFELYLDAAGGVETPPQEQAFETNNLQSSGGAKKKK